ncbi:MAG: hypothetical protein KY453_07650 [Gemmatimonadetes bacterium]|nr:hypothetical protein [Gemmatimonadota bacterium]
MSTLISQSGRDLGTEESGRVTLPRVALLGGEGTSPTSFGAHWYFLDHRLGLPFDAVDAQDVRSISLPQYDVIVVPSASGLSRALGEEGLERLLEWVRSGGHVVAVASAAEVFAEAVDVAMRTSEEAELERDERLARALRTGSEKDLETWESRTPGAVLPVRLDPGHPLAFGAGLAADPTRAFVLSTGTSFEPADDLETVAHFPAGVQEVSGVISPATLERLDRSSWLVRKSLDGGSVVLFADDPVFRIMWYAGFQPYVNALLLAPSL